jgi:hypothetical protein
MYRDSEDPIGGHEVLIDRLIGNAYETVKRVARHLSEIKRVSDWLKVLDSPPLPGPSDAIYEVPFSVTPIFNVGATFANELTLTGNVTSSTIVGIDLSSPMIIIRIVQDSVGGRTFVWPAAFTSHGDISLDPNAISQQMFAKQLDNTFSYVTPMMYPPA